MRLTRNPSLVSLFTGAYGLDFGLEKAGFKVMACVERDEDAVATIHLNKPSLKKITITKDINNVSVKEILAVSNLKKNGVVLVSGGPPCQPFSTVGRRHSVSSEDGQLFKKFVQIVWGLRPDFFIFENVKGIVSSALQHKPLNLRKKTVISPDEKLGSAWSFIKNEFDRTLRTNKPCGYNIFSWELNAADFGVAQNRKRVFIVGARKPIKLEQPKGRFRCKPIPLSAAIKALESRKFKPREDFMPYDKLRYKIFEKKLVKAGENWKVLPRKLQKKSMGRGWYATGGKAGFCRRLHWNKPCPTITTNPAGRATNLCHPTRPRPLTYQECALVQGFPASWKFSGSLTKKYKQIGNAVPIKLAEAIGKEIIRALAMKR